MEKSKFIARIMGSYYVILSAMMLFDMPLFLNHIRLMLVLPVLIFIVGIFTLILSLILVVSHPHWRMNWSILITFISWLGVCKGILLILHPKIFQQYSLEFVANIQSGYILAGVMLFFGLFLLLMGLKKT